MAAVCHHLLHRDLIGIAKETRMPTLILFLPFNSTMLEPVLMSMVPKPRTSINMVMPMPLFMIHDLLYRDRSHNSAGLA